MGRAVDVLANCNSTFTTETEEVFNKNNKISMRGSEC